MSCMFRNATSFNGDISSWDVSNVTNMDYMFYGATSFNGDLSSWDVSSVTNIDDMFSGDNSLSEENRCSIQTSFSTFQNIDWPYDWCPFAVVNGCIDETAFNYDIEANSDDGSCTYGPSLVSVEFTVDMNGVDQPSADYDNVVVNGSWNGWNGWGVTLTDEDEDGIYTGYLEVDSGTEFEYVVAVTGAADGYSGWGIQWGDGCQGVNVLVTAGEAGSVTASSLTPGCEEILGCMDTLAANYDTGATAQVYDQYGNLGCVYATCGDIPEYGCIYADGFGPFNDEFGAELCITYGGTPCQPSPECDFETSSLTMYGGSYDIELGIAIVSSSGDVMFGISNGDPGYEGFGSTSSLEDYPGYSPGTFEVCLDPNECYNLNLTDLYGDGWNGAYFTINDESFTLHSGGEINLKFGEMCPEEVCDYELVNYEVSQDTTFGVSVLDFNSNQTLYSVPSGSSGEFCLNPQGCYILQLSVGDGNVDQESQANTEVTEFIILGDEQYLFEQGEILAGGAYNSVDNWTTTFSDIYDVGCIVFGCTDSFSNNYNEMAIVNDGSCEQYPIGCTDPEAFNFYSLALVNDGTCVYDYQDLLFGTWNLDSWIQEGMELSNQGNNEYINFYQETNTFTVSISDPSGNFQFLYGFYQVNNNSLTLYPFNTGSDSDNDTNYYQGHYGLDEDTIMWDPNMLWSCSGCNGLEILDADTIMGMSLQDISASGMGLCFFNSTTSMSFETQEFCNSSLEQTTWIDLELFGGDLTILEMTVLNNQLLLTNEEDNLTLSLIESNEGCLDPNALNFNEQSNQQSFDDFGNLNCNYASCDDTPFEGCVYPDGFGPFNEYFGPESCIEYGGNPCLNSFNEDAYTYGCTDSTAFNFNPLADTDDESCIYDCNAVEIFEDFENFNAGEYLVSQSQELWTTWTNSPGTEEDAYVEDSLSYNGSNSLVLQGGGATDIVLQLGDHQNGIWNLSFMMYIPEGYGGYFNLLHHYNIDQNNNWAVEFMFGVNGQGYSDLGHQFDFSHDKWFEVKFNIDTENDLATCSIDGNLHNWPWTHGSVFTDNSLGALNFYATAPDGDALYYIDEVKLLSSYCNNFGCTQSWADNYDELAVVDDLSCFTWVDIVNSLQSEVDFLQDELQNVLNDNETLLVELDEALSNQVTCEMETEDIPLYLPLGWGMFGYNCLSPMELPEAFSSIEYQVVLVKDALGNAYFPEYFFNGIGSLEYSRGYQIKTSEEILDFSFCPTMTGLIQGNTNSMYQVGDLVEGGIVFYVDEAAGQVLVAAYEDVSQVDPATGNIISTYEWGCVDEYLYADGTGFDNTNAIVNQSCATQGGGITAAQAASDYESDGYTDWYLPSHMELLEMYNTIGNGAVILENTNSGNFYNDWYWSSSEGDFTNSYFVDFSNGTNYGFFKGYAYRVRAIRSFYY